MKISHVPVVKTFFCSFFDEYKGGREGVGGENRKSTVTYKGAISNTGIIKTYGVC